MKKQTAGMNRAERRAFMRNQKKNSKPVTPQRKQKRGKK